MTDAAQGELPLVTNKLNPESLEQWIVYTARFRAMIAKAQMDLVPQGRSVAWGYVRAFAHELNSQPSETYLDEIARAKADYEDCVQHGYAPDGVIERLYDVALNEMRRQGRQGKDAPTRTIAEQFVAEMT